MNPPRNRKGVAGNPPPESRRARVLSQLNAEAMAPEPEPRITGTDPQRLVFGGSYKGPTLADGSSFPSIVG